MSQNQSQQNQLIQTPAQQKPTTEAGLETVSQDEHLTLRARTILDEMARAQTVAFTIALASTAMSDIDGVSAAGADAQARRLTPKLDAEALLKGRTATGEPLPSSPVGITSPVVITRACLSLIKNKITIVDCGSFVPPQVEHISLSNEAAQNFTTADSLELERVEDLFRSGLELGQTQTTDQTDAGHLKVLAECVPGGTTTALAVLKALGVSADNLLSSSIQGISSSANKKAELVTLGLQRLDNLYRRDNWPTLVRANPLLAVSSLGDPMQAFAAGYAIGALKSIGDSDLKSKDAIRAVVLAGGSQMLAVYALVRAILVAEILEGSSALALLATECLAVITTKWVAHDPFADTQALAALVDAPYVASSINFKNSRHAGLRSYEDGHVKEGVGAGGALVLATLLADVDTNKIIETIDLFYDQMIG